jgi:hypothetical protein
MAKRKPAQPLDAGQQIVRADEEEKKQPKIEMVRVPTVLLQAAETVAAKVPKDKPVWQALFLHQKDGVGRIVALDGFSIFVGAFEAKPMPSWLKTGIAVAREDLRARVNMIQKIGSSDEVILAHAKGESRLTLMDVRNTMRFEVAAAEVKSMPDYEANLTEIDQLNVADMGEQGERSSKAEWEPVAIGSRYMQECNAIANILRATQDKASRSEHGIAIRMFHPNPSAPRIFDFDGWPGVMLIVGAMQMEVRQLPLLTQRLIEPASRGTLAALRAHETRWRDAAAAAQTEEQRAVCLAKAEDFQKRIQALIAVAASKPALAAPEAEKVDGEEAPLTPAEKAAVSRKRRAAQRAARVLH